MDAARVLVVDDEDVLVEMIAMIVADLGHTALTATNGREALERLTADAEDPDLIITDVMMPQMNGVELARAVREDKRLSDVPIILMSAAGRPHEDHLADHYINKPFDLDTLIDLIERYAHKG